MRPADPTGDGGWDGGALALGLGLAAGIMMIGGKRRWLGRRRAGSRGGLNRAGTGGGVTILCPVWLQFQWKTFGNCI